MIYTLPSISDKQNDPALVKYSLGNAKDFIKVINSNQLLISPTDNHLGFYTFGLNVVEVHQPNSQSQYQLKIEVYADDFYGYLETIKNIPDRLEKSTLDGKAIKVS